MTRTINLLSPRAERELYDDAGIDMAPESEDGAFPVLVLCPCGRDVPVGQDCAAHGCSHPDCGDCPGRNP